MEFCLDIRKALKIDGWMSETELQFLAETASNKRLIYEIGSYMGRSTRALADNTAGVVVAIDGWNTLNWDGNEAVPIFRTNEQIFNSFYCNLADHINSGKVIVPFKNWEDYHPIHGADFIFIDGEHSYASVIRDIEKACDLILPNGIIAGHDYAEPWKGVIKAVDESFLAVNKVDTIWWVEMR